MTVEKIPVDKEHPEVLMIDVIPDETIDSEKGYYQGVHVLLKFNKGKGVDRKEDQAYMDPDPDRDDMEDVKFDNERECH